MKDSLVSMNGYIGLGTKALKICNAVPKPKGAVTTTTGSTTTTQTSSSTDYSQYYDPSTYWQNYASWQTVCTLYKLYWPLTYTLLYVFLTMYFEIIFQQGYYDQSEGHALHDASANAESKKEDDLDLIGIIN